MDSTTPSSAAPWSAPRRSRHRAAPQPAVGPAHPGPLVLFVIWDLVVRFGLIKPILLPPPLATLGTLISGLAGGPLLGDFAVTVWRTVQAFFIAAVIGMPLGVLLGSNEKAYRSVEFLIDFFRSTPSSALIPLFLLIFGVSDINKVAIAAFGAFLIVVFNSAYGVINARKQRVMAAKVMGATRWQIFKDVLVWESLQPSWRRLLRSAVSMALVIVVVAEMFIGSDNGLGHRIIDAQQVLNVKTMYAAIPRPGILGYSTSSSSSSRRKIVHWSGDEHTVLNAPVVADAAAPFRPGPAGNAHHHPRPDQVLRRLAAVREF